MGRKEENTGFTCLVCGEPVSPLHNGSYRNHCPFCLSSLHVDEQPGDRAIDCRGVMNAVALVSSKKGWQLLHRCSRCRAVQLNRIAPDDDVGLIAQLSAGQAPPRRRGRGPGKPEARWVAGLDPIPFDVDDPRLGDT